MKAGSRYRHGLVIGKFMPIHLGHVALAEFAASRCERLSLLVGALRGEPIPGPIRFRWAKEALAHIPNVTVDYTEEELPTAATSSREVSAVWARWLGARYPEVDCVISSEDYGAYLAEYMGVASLSFDPGRRAVPVSASAIREDSLANWDFIAPPARPWFVKAVCLYGPESTGKTTMTERLARRFASPWVPEMARIYIGDRAPAKEDIDAVAPLHARAVLDARRTADRLLFVDSDLLTTRFYARSLFGYEPVFPDWVEEADRYDLYLLFYPDNPYVADVQRAATDQRLEAFAVFESMLRDLGRPYVVIRGSWKEREEACAGAIKSRWPALAAKDGGAGVA